MRFSNITQKQMAFELVYYLIFNAKWVYECFISSELHKIKTSSKGSVLVLPTPLYFKFFPLRFICYFCYFIIVIMCFHKLIYNSYQQHSGACRRAKAAPRRHVVMKVKLKAKTWLHMINDCLDEVELSIIN